MMHIGIVGSRTFDDYDVLHVMIDDWIRTHARFDRVTIVSGGAQGADSLARMYAEELGLEIIEHFPDRERYGWPRAAFERNGLIVNDSDVLFAFFGPKEPPMRGDRHFGSGTMDTVQKAMMKRIPVIMGFEP